MTPIELLRSVLCDPDVNVVIRGSDADRDIITNALKSLEQQIDNRNKRCIILLNGLRKLIPNLSPEQLGAINNALRAADDLESYTLCKAAPVASAHLTGNFGPYGSIIDFDYGNRLRMEIPATGESILLYIKGDDK